MRMVFTAALLAGIAFSGSAFAAPSSSPTPTPQQRQALAKCDQLKSATARQSCRSKATAAKPAPRKPVTQTQGKPAPKKPTVARTPTTPAHPAPQSS